MRPNNGTVRQKINVSVNTSIIIDQIIDDIAESILSAITEYTSDCNIYEDYEIYDNDVEFQGYYDTPYSERRYFDTDIDTAYCEIKKDIAELDNKIVTDHVKKHIIENTDIAKLVKNLKVTIDENEDDAYYEPEEPDYDSMPCGHDDY